MGKAAPLSDPCGEILSRISLMTGVGFGLRDIASRLAIDKGVDLGVDMVQILQAELRLSKSLNTRLELQGRLIRHGLNSLDSASLATLLFENPVRGGVELAGYGLLGKGSRILLGLPRATANSCRMGAELWRVANGHLVMPLWRLQSLIKEAGLTPKDLETVFPGKSAAFRGANIRLEVPVGKNPFKRKPSLR